MEFHDVSIKICNSFPLDRSLSSGSDRSRRSHPPHYRSVLSRELGSGSSTPAAALDGGFARNGILTLIHILPGALFLVLAAFQFAPGIRRKHLQFHRWSGRVLVVTGLIVGVSALVMSYRMNIGGPNETAATTLFAIVFLICLIKAYVYIRRKEVARHREWMIRAYAVGLGVATTRPIVGSVLCLSPTDATRVLRDRVLAGIHDHASCSRGVDRLHAIPRVGANGECGVSLTPATLRHWQIYPR